MIREKDSSVDSGTGHFSSFGPESSRKICTLLGSALALILVSSTILAEEEKDADGSADPGDATSQQSEIEFPFPPEYSTVDEAGVDMISGRTRFSVQGLSIGDDLGLEHSVYSDPNGFNWLNPLVDSYSGGVGDIFESFMSPIQIFFTTCGSTTTYVAGIGGSYERFCLVDGEYLPVLKSGSTLVDHGDGTWRYTKKDGSSYLIDTAYKQGASEWGNIGLIVEGRYPNGKKFKIHRKTVEYYSPSAGANRSRSRIQSVTNNAGYQIKYHYAVNSIPTDSTVREWANPIAVTAVNNAYEYCDPMADFCTLQREWPSASYAWSGNDQILTVTDSANRVTRYTHDTLDRVVGVKPPSSSVDKITYDYCPQVFEGRPLCFIDICIVCNSYVVDIVQEAVVDGQNFGYLINFAPAGSPLLIYNSIHPLGGRIESIRRASTGIIDVFRNRAGAQFQFELQRTNRLLQRQDPNGAVISYRYDDRSNVLEVRDGPFADETAPVLFRAHYPAECTNPMTCNQPVWTEDANGNRTDYSYDPLHGGITKITQAAVNGIRAETRFAYIQKHAWIKSSKGSFVQSPEPIWLKKSEETCRTSAATTSGCASPGDEVTTSFDYGPNSGPSNLLLRGEEVAADGEVLRQCYSYDRFGNRISETAPNAGRATCP